MGIKNNNGIRLISTIKKDIDEGINKDKKPKSLYKIIDDEYKHKFLDSNFFGQESAIASIIQNRLVKNNNINTLAKLGYGFKGKRLEELFKKFDESNKTIRKESNKFAIDITDKLYMYIDFQEDSLKETGSRFNEMNCQLFYSSPQVESGQPIRLGRWTISSSSDLDTTTFSRHRTPEEFIGLDKFYDKFIMVFSLHLVNEQGPEWILKIGKKQKNGN